jgi:hypothetical protein
MDSHRSSAAELDSAQQAEIGLPGLWMFSCPYAYEIIWL